MNNRLDPDTDLNGATGEGMTYEALSQSDEELKLLRHDEDYGEVFREEWESDYSEHLDEEEDGSGDPDVTITTSKEELIQAMKQKEENERPNDEWKEAEEERKMAEQGAGDEGDEEEQALKPKTQAGKDQKGKKKSSG
jgi:hypothetical protein